MVEKPKKAAVPEIKEQQIKIKIVSPHNKRSRLAKESDVPKILEDAEQMGILMDRLVNRKVFAEIFALAHSQINDVDPIRFFMVNVANPHILGEMPDDDFLIINPVIKNHTKVAVRKDEGCVTFPTFGQIRMDRWNKIEVEYTTLQQDGDELVFTDRKTVNLSGIVSQMFQHEIDHFDGKWIHKFEIRQTEIKADRPKENDNVKAKE